MKNPLYCAIDTSDFDRAIDLVLAVRPHVGGLKLGLEFFAAHGPLGVEALAEEAELPIFLDLKLHDIPNTVAGAVAALSHLPISILTVHAGSGRDMMAAARDAAPKSTRIVGVTVLTSLDNADLRDLGISGATEDQVARLARLAGQAGLDGVVCSPREVAMVRGLWPRGLLVVPGIRPEGSVAGDQKRTLTPAEATRAGADVLVIGRPITGAPDPRRAAMQIAASLA